MLKQNLCQPSLQYEKVVLLQSMQNIAFLHTLGQFRRIVRKPQQRFARSVLLLIYIVWIMEKPCHSHQKSPATIAPKRGETDIGQHLYIYLHGKITATPLYGYQLN